jgi:hypothetical protein
MADDNLDYTCILISDVLKIVSFKKKLLKYSQCHNMALWYNGPGNQ